MSPLTAPEVATPPARKNCLARTSAQIARVGSDVLALPFDIARAQYAKAVQLGLVERSLLASGRFGQTLSALEKLTLGPLARTR